MVNLNKPVQPARPVAAIPLDMRTNAEIMEANRARLAGQRVAPKYFEIVGHGFDASDDKTDDRVCWLEAESEQQIAALLAGVSYRFCGPLPLEYEPIDFKLPGDTAALIAVLKKWENSP